MGRKAKGKQHLPDAAAGAGGGEVQSKAEVSQLWAALKHSDEAELQRLLFDEIEDVETGTSRRIPKAAARKMANQLNAKKVLPLSYVIAEGLGNSLLHLLLCGGAAVNKSDDTAKRQTPLHAACWSEDEEAVVALLRAGADPRIADADGRTPLHILATSNAGELVTRILQLVAPIGTQASHDDEEKGDVATMSATSSSVTLTTCSPIELLSKVERVGGCTVLHLALEDSTYNFSVAQALLDYLEKIKNSGGNGEAVGASAVAQLLSQTSTDTGDTPLHLLVGATNTEDALVNVLARRLLDLGADPLLRNRDGRTPAEMAVVTRPGRNSESTTELYKTLLRYTLERHDSSIADRNVDGLALIHVAIVARSTSAVKALCALMADASQAVELLGSPVTASDGTSVVSLLVSHNASAEIANALVAVGAISREEYELAKAHCQKQPLTPPEEEAIDGSSEDGAEGRETESGYEENAATAAAAILKRRQGAAGTASRVQQARKARAATAAQRKQQGATHTASRLGGDNENWSGGDRSCGGVTAPVFITGVLLLLAILASFFGVFSRDNRETLH